MTRQKWMLIGGAVVAGVIALSLGVSPSAILWVGLLLLCPAAMYFGMRGMGKPRDQQGRGPTNSRDADQSKKEVTTDNHEQSGKV